MEETGIFHQSIRDTKVFPEYMCNMIQIGEESGRLDEVMSALSEHYEQQETISRSIKNAITYPFIMITMMLAVILVLIVKVMPVFNQVYEQLGTGLTGVSKNILNLGILMNRLQKKAGTNFSDLAPNCRLLKNSLKKLLFPDLQVECIWHLKAVWIPMKVLKWLPVLPTIRY